jgi:hypothetical protein
MPQWTLLVISLPGRQPTARMRVWRALKGFGAAVLRDGVYLLPHSKTNRSRFDEQARDVIRTGGEAHVLDLDHVTSEQERSFRALFDRTTDYTNVIEALRRLRTGLNSKRVAAGTRELKHLRRELEQLRDSDHFPGAAATQAAELLAEVETLVEQLRSPGEPSTEDRRLERRAIKDYQGRAWATRAHPWIDRLASAWLIKRFIDPKARFLWLKDPKKCPKHALGFDFDGAAFTHSGSRVTFEALLTSFGLENDAALARLGTAVHQLDVGGAPVPEAPGLELILRGIRQRCRSDNQLLSESIKALDDFYAALSEQ